MFIGVFVRVQKDDADIAVDVFPYILGNIVASIADADYKDAVLSFKERTYNFE